MARDAIRADPAARLPPRPRRHFSILRDASLAWVQTGRTARRMAVVLAATTLIWGALRFACLHVIDQAHLNLPGAAATGRKTWDIAGLFLAAALADAGPVFAAAAVMPPMHRLILGQAAPNPAASAARAAQMLGVVFFIALTAVIVLNAYLLLPLILLRALGRTSTILTMILLLPPVCLAGIALLRLAHGLPALSLGLARALTEGWAITNGRTLRILAIWVVALAPFIALTALWVWLHPDPFGWPALILRPCIDVALVALTAALTGVFYRVNRLPGASRPDVRPSRNPTQRKAPVFS